MKVLIAGNSQAGALFRAAKLGLSRDLGDIELHFFVVPGGVGPNFRISNDRLVVTNFNEKFPPYKMPEDVDLQPLSSFDAVVVSALGYVDGGFMYQNPILMQGIVAEFGPHPTASGHPLISQATQRAVMENGLLKQQGYVFLQQLRQAFSGRVLVQPFPYLSDYLLERDDWVLRRFYEDVESANRYFASLRDEVNASICKKMGVELINYPDTAFSAASFTPRRLMSDKDGLHPGIEYGGMVLTQIATAFLQPVVPSY